MPNGCIVFLVTSMVYVNRMDKVLFKHVHGSGIHVDSNV